MSDTNGVSSASTPGSPGETTRYGCTCGAVRGSARGLGAGTGLRLVCMCTDCQAFLVHLGREELLDSHRGTEIYQTTPRRITIDAGAEHVRCLRLSAKGLHRWYATCCNTPLGNMVGAAGVPFIGIPTVALGTAEQQAALGPVRARIHARHAPAPSPEAGHPRAPLSVIFRVVGFLFRSWIARAHKPSPFRRDDGSWIREPYVLTDEERANAYGAST